MAYLKQRLETLLGHEITVNTEEVTANRGQLTEAGKDYVGMVDDSNDLHLVLITHIRNIRHSPYNFEACSFGA